jgi:protein-tyrosine kinase
VGITSPTKGCGKTFTALNLAITLSRYDNARTVLLDLDLRMPSLARTLAVDAPGRIGDLLRGDVRPEDHLRRFEPNRLNIGAHLALGLNAAPEPYPAELLHQTGTANALAAIRDKWRPDVLLYDLPPILVQDDVLALRPQMDAVLIVAGGGRTSARELREAQRRLGDQMPVLGIVLNMAEGNGTRDYAY